ncbi:MAG TPA: oligoribonuclease [Microbacteriaceae bacterium]|nr:oligoribonuclease [Microbacteriaceae bacterium]
MAASQDLLVWIDCEMTGLDLERDELVEVAIVITDYDLNAVDPGFEIVIAPSASALDGMSDFVRDMHTESGLLEHLGSGVELADAQAQILAYIQRFIPTAGSAPLAGNTIGTDRAFLAKYMPLVDGHLHYRSVDVSSIKELSKRWYPRVFFQAPTKHGGHRALADIRESIRELEYYRRAVFVEPPGPSSDQAQEISGAVTLAFTDRV